MIKVAEMMSQHPHSLQTSDTLSDAKNLMDIHQIRHVPIVDEENHLLGLVSQRDILAAQDSCLEKITLDSRSPLDIALGDVMHRQIMTITPRGGLKEAALFMQDHKVGCLPVVENNKLVGIITDTDFVAIAINLLELQEDSEPEKVEQ